VTEGFSGADVSALANTAVSLVLHEYLAKYSTPEEAAKHASVFQCSTFKKQSKG
jgi:transitional endoplasmic reticulum ATPase